MRVLLIEDDKNHCTEYSECIEYLPYAVELSVANGCERGLELTRDFEPDIILLDLELHRSDGDGILFLEKLKKPELKTLPYIIVITINDSRRAHKISRQCGADYIFIKSKPDYSPYLIFDFAHNYFKHQSSYSSATATDDKKLSIEITRELEKVGITHGVSGGLYITDSIMVILNLYKNKLKSSNINLSTHIYPVVAKRHKKSAKTVEQGIRNAIQRAWTIQATADLAESYTPSINADTGFPENRDFLFYYANLFHNGDAEHN